MPFADNIISDYGAVADGQWAAATLTISTNVLTSATPLWSAGDVGKSIVVGQAGGAGPQGGSPLRGTIAAPFISSTQINLSASAGQVLSAEPNVIVAWGTNNAAAFTSFQSARAGDTGTLTIPSSGTGVYLISSGNFGGLFSGIRSVTVNMTGATIAGGSFQIGGAGQYSTSGHASRTISVNAGASFVTLVTPSEVSRFTVGQYALMTGLSLQYGGYPANHQRIEYCLITAIDSDSGSPTYGKITFAAQLANSYLSTWPLYDATVLDYGGPATLYAFDPTFDITLVINGGTFAHHAQFAAVGLNVVFNDCVFKGLYGPYPTMTKTCAFNRCTGVSCNMEIDKYISDLSMTGCAWGTVQAQSTAPTLFTLDGTTITFTLLGTPYKTVIRNGCSIGTLSPSSQYGIANELNVSDSVVSNFGAVTFHQSGHLIAGGDNNNNGVNIDFSMSNGIIVVPLSFKAFGLIEQWAVTGMQMFFVDANVGTIGSFRITNVTQDAINVYVHTDWPSGGFPPRSYGVNQLWLRTHAAPICTFNNVTGCQEVVDLSGAPIGAPLYSYTKRTYDGSLVAGRYWQVWGKISRVNIVVTTPYSGATGTVTTSGMMGTIVKAADVSDFSFSPVVNLKVAGTRSLDCQSGYPAVWSGAQSGDTLPTVTEALWMCGNNRMSMTDISAQSAGVWPSFSIEIVTDQGLWDQTISRGRSRSRSL